jgi:hypothetical protein
MPALRPRLRVLRRLVPLHRQPQLGEFKEDHLLFLYPIIRRFKVQKTRVLLGAQKTRWPENPFFLGFAHDSAHPPVHHHRMFARGRPLHLQIQGNQGKWPSVSGRRRKREG